MWRTMLRVAFLIYLVVAANAAAASYVKDYAAWKRLDDLGKAMYAVGLFDGMTLYSGDSAIQAQTLGLISCSIELSLTSTLLAEAIQNGYRRDAATWKYPPSVILSQEITFGACLSHVNKQRTMQNLPIIVRQPLP